MLLMLVSGMKYQSMYKGNADIMLLMAGIPRAFAVLIGIGGTADFSTEKGFFSLVALYYMYIAIFHASLLGASSICREEERKTAGFLFSKPVSRGAVLQFKLEACAVCCTVLNALTMLACLVVFPSLLPEILITAALVFVLQLIYLVIGTACGVVSKKPGKAGTHSCLWALGALLLAKALDLADSQSFIWVFTPMKYFIPEKFLFGDGISPIALVLSAILIGGIGALTFSKFQKKDLHNV